MLCKKVSMLPWRNILTGDNPCFTILTNRCLLSKYSTNKSELKVCSIFLFYSRILFWRHQGRGVRPLHIYFCICTGRTDTPPEQGTDLPWPVKNKFHRFTIFFIWFLLRGFPFRVTFLFLQLFRWLRKETPLEWWMQDRRLDYNLESFALLLSLFLNLLLGFETVHPLLFKVVDNHRHLVR